MAPVSLFGTLTSLDVLSATVSFIIVVFVVQVFDYVLTGLTELTVDTPYDELVMKINEIIIFIPNSYYYFM